MTISKDNPVTLSGRCMCGAVAFECRAEGDKVHACHCGQCRQWSGHLWASLNVPFASLKFQAGEESVGWHRSSDYARRGFCKECGSALFWHADKLDEHKATIAIAAGAVNAPTQLKMSEHIFVADKGDYYDIADGLPQKEKY